MKKIFDPGTLTDFFQAHRFSLISWGVTVLLAAGMLGATVWWTQVGSVDPILRPQPTAVPNQNQPSVGMPPAFTNPNEAPGIPRFLQLKTNIPERPRFKAVLYRVTRGDAIFSIAKQYNIKPESILYTNKDVLQDNPHNLRPGMELTIPPVDGLYYTWKDGDKVAAVAAEFKAKEDDILNFPGNNIDLTDPTIKPGSQVMIPGGKRELVDWTKFIPTISRNPKGGTGTSDIGGHSCGGGPVGSGFLWPTGGPHTISGNDYGPGHLGIDITANQGDPVYASASGVVVMAQGGDNYGYGNVIQIDHGNGYATIYAHLSQINVSPCEGVTAGQLIGLAGSTGNSTGAHLHFEIREGGQNVNPWYLLQ